MVTISKPNLASLRKELADLVKTLETENTNDLTLDSYVAIGELDAKFSKKAIFKGLKHFCGERPLFNVIINEINRYLKASFAYSKKDKILIKDIPGFIGENALLNLIINAIKEIPWNYAFVLELPGEYEAFLEEDKQSNKIGTQITICRIDNSFRKSHPLQTGNELIDQELKFRGGRGLLIPPEEEEWLDNKIAFQFSSKGYVTKYWETPIVNEFEECLETFIGLSLIFKIFKVRQERDLLYPKFNSSSVVYKKNYRTLTPTFTVQLGDEVSGLLKAVEFIPLTPEEEPYRKAYPLLLQHAFGESPEQKRIRLASRWLLKSYFFKNEIMAFVNAVIALETIFGEQKESNPQGNKSLIANRCAYLLCTNRKNRKNIAEDIIDIYKIRNDIVHKGKNKFTAKDQGVFRQLRWILGASLYKELVLIHSEKED